jgi:hypothetical protein
MYKQVTALQNILCKIVPGGKGAPHISEAISTTLHTTSAAPSTGSSARSDRAFKANETAELRSLQVAHFKQKALSQNLSSNTATMMNLRDQMTTMADFKKIGTVDALLAAAICQKTIDSILLSMSNTAASPVSTESAQLTPSSFGSGGTRDISQTPLVLKY